jgi:acyl dehydratase
VFALDAAGPEPPNGKDAVVIGATVSDLEEGDVLPAIRYDVTAHVAREYARATEWTLEEFHDAGPESLAPPSLIHALKVRLLDHACPLGAGPQARIHYEYDVVHHRPLRIGQRLRVFGQVMSRSVRRDRHYLTMTIWVHQADDDALVATYRDVSIIAAPSTGGPS